jgi:hypothetical protein
LQWMLSQKTSRFNIIFVSLVLYNDDPPAAEISRREMCGCDMLRCCHGRLVGVGDNVHLRAHTSRNADFGGGEQGCELWRFRRENLLWYWVYCADRKMFSACALWSEAWQDSYSA